MKARTSSAQSVSGSEHGYRKRDSELNAVFSALSDPTRRAILERLSGGEANVTEIADPFQMSLPAVSKHLRILQSSGLISRTKQGRVHKLHLTPAGLIFTLDWMEHYRPLWKTQLDSLSAYLEREEKGKAR